MKRIILIMASVLCVMLVFMAEPISVMANEYETWDGEGFGRINRDGVRYIISKKKDDAKKINGEVWIEADSTVSIIGKLTIPKIVKERESDKIGYAVVGICSYGFNLQNKITAVNIEADLKEIGEKAFYSCEKLKKINLPSSLRYIGTNAFSATALKDIKIPSKVKVIKEGTFEGCSSLTKVTMEKSVTRIDDSAFASCAKLKTIILSKNLKTLGYHVFGGCRALKSITLPDTINNIGESCFKCCTSLKNLTLPSNVTKISEGLFYECTSLEKVVLGNDVKDIEDGAFSMCSALTEIKLPPKLKTINANAFNNSGLKNIDFPDSLRTIGPYAFCGCDKLHEAIIPEGVTKIDECAFSECEVLQRVEIPSTVKVIGKNAFWMCRALSELRLAEGVEEIGESAFHSTNLSEIDFPKSATIMYETSFMETPFIVNLNLKIQEEKDLFDYYIVNGNLLMANEYEYDADRNEYVGKKIHKIPDNVKRILCGIGTILTEEIDIPSGVEYMTSVIGIYDEIKLPSKLKHIDRIASPNLILLKLPDGLEELPEIECKSITSITVPSKITEITRNKPFQGCTNLKKLVFKGKLTYLPAGLLSGTQVTSFTIPETVETLNNINEGTELDSIVIPVGAKTIYWMNDTNLKNLEFKEGYNDFYSIDFSFCTSLENVKLPDSMTRIPRMFTGCVNLKKIILPKNLKVIEFMAFSDTGITDVTIPKGCESIEAEAFDSGTTLRIHKDSKLLDHVEELVNSGYKIVKYK